MGKIIYRVGDRVQSITQPLRKGTIGTSWDGALAVVWRDGSVETLYSSAGTPRAIDTITPDSQD